MLQWKLLLPLEKKRSFGSVVWHLTVDHIVMATKQLERKDGLGCRGYGDIVLCQI